MTAGSAGSAAWVNGIQVAAGLFFLSVGAATSLAEERIRGSLDVLLTTRLSTVEIVLGKWLGTYRFVPLLAVLPRSSYSVSYGTTSAVGRLSFCSRAMCSAGAAITSLGLAMAVWCSRPGRALAATVAIYIVVAVGWMFLVMTLSGMDSRTREY